ncbi:MAG TPA: hypothetical protein VF701_08395 [Thermoanaerobaculia bacterium]
MAGSALAVMLVLSAAAASTPPQPATPADLFASSTSCVACHTGLTSPSGEEVPIASGWRASMMANAARDPYWQAAVRRETLDHPAAAADIEHECSACHMPMVRFADHHAGRKTSVFAQTTATPAVVPVAALAMDGVSCTVCHQITDANLAERSSFNANFEIDTTRRVIGGPFEIDPGRTRVMSSATGFSPARQDHLQSSAVCATCHTLYTHALSRDGKPAGELPEQVPFLEWRHSAWRGERSCQSCHMPVRTEETAISSVLPQPRPAVSEHDFRGGNAFMMGILRTNAVALGVTAPPEALLESETRAIEHLKSHTARLTLGEASIVDGVLQVDVSITNLAGHKLPTAYPSRRVWLHLAVRDSAGAVVFESGAVRPDGSIEGNDNDLDGARFEPHYRTIERTDQVQIYEAILADAEGDITTGLIRAVRYVKDNRILPRGFDKRSAHRDIAVYGDALDDPAFRDAGHRTRYAIALGEHAGPFTVHAALLYQSIGFRWADNLAAVDSMETKRFASMYAAAAAQSSTLLATASATIEPSEVSD